MDGQMFLLCSVRSLRSGHEQFLLSARGRRQGPGRQVQRHRPFRGLHPPRRGRRLGRAGGGRAGEAADHPAGREGPQDHHPQRQPRHRLQLVDQSVPGLRARLHLLLRAAQPRLHGLSPGVDFETRLFFKPEAARLLERELSRPGYVCERIQLGANTDPYQPVERKLLITRGILQVLEPVPPPGDHHHQERAGRPRRRHPGADGPGQPDHGVGVDHHPGPQARPAPWSRAASTPERAAAGAEGAVGRRRAHHGSASPR